MLNVILGDWLDESLSTPGSIYHATRSHFRSKYFQLGNWNSSLVGEQRTEHAAFPQHRLQVSSFVKA